MRVWLAESSTPSATCCAPEVRAALLDVRVSSPSVSCPRPLSSWLAPSSRASEPAASCAAPAFSCDAPSSSWFMASFSAAMPSVKSLRLSRSKTSSPCPSASALAAQASKIWGAVSDSTSASTVTLSCKYSATPFTCSGSRPSRDSFTPGRVTKAATLLLAALSSRPFTALTLLASSPSTTPTAVTSGVTMVRSLPFTVTLPVSLLVRSMVSTRWPLWPRSSLSGAVLPSNV